MLEKNLSYVFGLIEHAFLHRTIALSYGAFTQQSRFVKELQGSFGSGIIVNGGITKSDLSDYLMFLKDEYISNGEPKCFKVANYNGYMGDGYWFLSPEVNIKITLSIQNCFEAFH